MRKFIAPMLLIIPYFLCGCGDVVRPDPAPITPWTKIITERGSGVALMIYEDKQNGNVIYYQYNADKLIVVPMNVPILHAEK